MPYILFKSIKSVLSLFEKYDTFTGDVTQQNHF